MSVDIVEELRKWAALKVGHTLTNMHVKAANTIAQLRYDHERDVEKIAALQLRLEQYRFVTDERIDA